jgi:hypothetical protein
MQASQCGSQVGTKLLEVARNKHGIGLGGEFFGESDFSQLGRINVLHHEVPGGKYVRRAVLMDP